MRTIRQIFLLTAFASGMWAQFTTNSTGSDGAYNPTASAIFDPVALGLDPSGDNIFNFTTINIPTGVTITLLNSKLRNAAVTWLASGNVTIAGTLNLSGAAGAALTTGSAAQVASTRVPAEPGPGGYPGGLGSQNGVGPQSGAGPGGGPGGLNSHGNPYTCVGGAASYIANGPTYVGSAIGTTYGSYLLVPLYGGSGGGGAWDENGGSYTGGTGGAGGGAIRIASNTQISITGTINANGGTGGTVSGSTAGCQGGPGSGGAVHLVAPTITGTGAITITSGCQTYICTNNNGIIVFSANTNSFTGSAPGLVLGPLYLPPANSTLALPSISITQINGVAVPAAPGGQYLIPDVVVSAPGAVGVNIAAANIPLGTAVNLRLTNGTGSDQSITCPGLAGTVAASTATCTATFPFSISIAMVTATW